MKEPIQNRDTSTLNPRFRKNLLSFIAAFNAFYKGKYTMKVAETFRTNERQRYLYSLHNPAKGIWKTNCDGVHTYSMHYYRIAADLFVLDRWGRINYNYKLWRAFYAAVRPSAYGLEIIPQELVHVQLAGSQAQYFNGRLSAGYLAQITKK